MELWIAHLTLNYCYAKTIILIKFTGKATNYNTKMNMHHHHHHPHRHDHVHHNHHLSLQADENYLLLRKSIFFCLQRAKHLQFELNYQQK